MGGSMQAYKQYLILAAAMMMSVACSQMNFTPSSLSAPQTQSIIAPIATPPSVVIVPPVVPVAPRPIVMNQGLCAYDQKLTSCMACPSAPAPIPLTKAQQLAQIMSMGCQISNSSDPKGYVSPNYQNILSQVDMCNSTIYPISSSAIGNPSALQISVVNQLMTPDSSLRQTMFGKLFYTGNYSDAFETYFGIGLAEARYLFCYQSNNISGDLITLASVKASETIGLDQWLGSNPKGVDQMAYKTGNYIRGQLESCLDAPGSPAGAPNSTKVCSYKSYPGISIADAKTETVALLVGGYKISVENNSLCMAVSKISDLDGQEGPITLAGMLCQ